MKGKMIRTISFILIAVVAITLAACTNNVQVTFDADNGTENVVVDVVSGELVTQPTDPTKDGYTFEAWYLGDEPFDFETPVTESITLVAKYTQDVTVTYTVTFDANGGTSIDSQTVEAGSTANEPTAPTKDGYTFDGWYLGDDEFAFTTPINEDITLVAKWTENVSETVTVTFDTVGAGDIPAQTIDYGTVAVEPTAPTKSYFSFDGWLLENEPFSFETVVTKDITLKANFSYIGIPDSPLYEGRAFNSDFDQLLNDFTSTSLTGTASNAAIDSEQPYISVGYSGAIGADADGALWKQAGSQNSESAAYQYLVLRLRGFEGASIEDLSIGFRYDDNHELLVVPLTEALDPDLEPISRELDGDWYNYVLSITDTLDGKVYQAKDGFTDVDASGTLVGFHLLNTSNNGSGILHIKDAYYSKVPNPTYPYEGSDYSQNRDYWYGTIGTTVSTYVTVESGGSYSEYIAEPNEENTHLVLSLRQDEAGLFDASLLSISPVFTDGTVGDPVSYDQITDTPMLGSSWLNVIIPIEDIYSGDQLVAGYELRNDGPVAIAISYSFLSYLGEYTAVSYPILDLENALIYDDFNREVIGTTPMYSSDNQVAIDHGFTYLISYAGMQASSIADGVITLDSTGGEYIDYVVHSSEKANMNAYRYLVIKYQSSEDEPLANLRLQQKDYNDANVGGVIYANQMLAGLGLSSIPEDEMTYPYIMGDWHYLVVDLVLTEGLSPDFAGMTLYYTGTGLSIDTILFANALSDVDETSEFIIADFDQLEVGNADAQLSDNQWWANTYDSAATIVEDGETKALQMDGTGYAQYHTAVKSTGRYLAFDLKVTTPGTIESFRIGGINNPTDAKWAKDGQLIMANGVPMVVNADGEWHHYVIDWVASGLEITDTFGFHASDGEIYLLDNLAWYQALPYFDDELVWGDFEWASVGDANSQFGTGQYWANNYGLPSSIVDIEGNLQLKLDGSEGYVQYHTGVAAKPNYIAFDITVEAAGSFGIMLGGTHKWNDQLIGLDGNPIVLPAVGETAHIIVDVALSELTYSDEFAIEAQDGAVYYIDNLSFQWNDELATLFNVLSYDFESNIVDGSDDYWWHAGDPTDGVFNLVTADYTTFRFGSPKIAGATVITIDAKLAEESASSTEFRLELGDGNIVYWSTLVADGVVSELTTEMQTFVIDLSPYLTTHASGFEVLGFHINNGGVVLDNLNIYVSEYVEQMQLLD